MAKLRCELPFSSPLFGLITIIDEGHLPAIIMSISMLLFGMLRGEANLARFAGLIWQGQQPSNARH
jgi:hypothetical protein